jgi:hypothetical protein
VSLNTEESLFIDLESPANALVIRFSLADDDQGEGTKADLGIYFEDKLLRKITLDSQWSYAYGDFPWSTNPDEGMAHKFWDEMHSLLPPIMTDGSIELRFLESQESTVLYIDLIDVEWVEPPKTKPVDFINFQDFGASPEGDKDCTEALVEALQVASQEKTGVYIPPGRYIIGQIDITEPVKIYGAGMWYSRFEGSQSRFHFMGMGGGEFRDFAILGDTDHRDDQTPIDNAFSGTPIPGTVLENIWVEHKKCAFWVGEGRNEPVVKNLTIKGCRFRNLMADAVNFCNGTSDCTVMNTHVRYSGDDALATWSAPGDPACRRNRFINNWIQLPWLANGIALYGGEDHLVYGNRIEDNIHTGSGLYVAAHFQAAPFTGTHRLMNNDLVRAGTLLSDQGGPAGAMRVLGWRLSIFSA